MGRNLYARLVAYEADGDKTGPLPEPLSWQALSEFDETGSLTVDYSTQTAGGGISTTPLHEGMEIAVEVSDGGNWVEPSNMRFLVVKREGDQTDATGTITFTCVSYGWLLNKILNLNVEALATDGDNKGKRPFLSATPGTIIKTFLNENMERDGAARCLTTGFDTAKDTGGDKWARVQTLYYSIGVDLKTCLDSMVGAGVCDWDVQGRELRVWNPDSVKRSRDLSDSIVIQLARDVLGEPFEETIEDLASHILVTGDDDLVFTQDNAAAPTPWGKWETYVSQGGVSDKDTATAFMQVRLEELARMRGSYTADMLVSDATWLPLVDYQPGDWITAPTVNHGEKVRVRQIKLALDNTDGAANITCSVVLNDALYDSQVRQSKKINGITGGAALAGSEGSTVNRGNDHRVPVAPEGLVVTTDAYVDRTGVARGLAVAGWGEVTKATDGTAIDIKSYEVNYRRDDNDTWESAGSTSGLTLSWGGLACGSRLHARVRAVPTYSDKYGEWSDTVTVTVESDVTPPSVPSRPILSSSLGVVEVRSDGLNNVGGGFEPDTKCLEVGRSRSDGNWVKVGSIQVGSVMQDIGLELDETYWYALRSVDYSGNRSDWSEGASVKVAPAVTQDELNDLAEQVENNSQVTADLQDQYGQISGDLEQVRNDLEDNAAALEEANKELASVSTVADKALEQAGQAYETATSAKTTADGLHNIFKGPDDPTTLEGVTVKQGDFWLVTQSWWTTWEGDENDSTSLLADFLTYWEGDENDSTSVLLPLDSRVIAVRQYDGERWSEFNLVASNIIATGSIVGGLIAAGTIVAGNLAADSVTSDKIVSNAVTADKLAANSVNADKIAANAVTAGKIAANAIVSGKIAAGAIDGMTITGATIQTSSTANRGVKITSGGLSAYDSSGNAKTVINASTGQITTDGAVISNGGIKSTTIDGGVITGAVFRSSASSYPRFQVSGTDLDLWDSDGVNTVHLDGDGADNTITGSFRTRPSGSTDYPYAYIPYTQYGETVAGERLTGAAYRFVSDNVGFNGLSYYDKGDAHSELSRIGLQAGRVRDGGGVSSMVMMNGVESGSNAVTSAVYAMADYDYDDMDSGTDNRMSSWRLESSSSRRVAQMTAYGNSSRFARLQALSDVSGDTPVHRAMVAAYSAYGEARLITYTASGENGWGVRVMRDSNNIGFGGRVTGNNYMRTFYRWAGTGYSVAAYSTTTITVTNDSPPATGTYRFAVSARAGSAACIASVDNQSASGFDMRLYNPTSSTITGGANAWGWLQDASTIA